jgi:hypothetical protein
MRFEKRSCFFFCAAAARRVSGMLMNWHAAEGERLNPPVLLVAGIARTAYSRDPEHAARMR